MWLPKNLGIDNLLIEKGIDPQILKEVYKHDFETTKIVNGKAENIPENIATLRRIDGVLQSLTTDELKDLFYSQETTKAGKVFRSLRKRTLTDEEAIDALDPNRHREDLSESIRSLDIEINKKKRAILQNPDNRSKYENEMKDKESQKAELIAEHELSDRQLKVLLKKQLRNNPKPWDDRVAVNNADKKIKDRDKKHSSNVGRFGLNTGMGIGSLIAILFVGGASAAVGAALVGGAIGATLGGVGGMLLLAGPISRRINNHYIPISKAKRQSKQVKELIEKRTNKNTRSQELINEKDTLENNHRVSQKIKNTDLKPAHKWGKGRRLGGELQPSDNSTTQGQEGPNFDDMPITTTKNGMYEKFMYRVGSKHRPKPPPKFKPRPPSQPRGLTP
ncbi:hypothetical protein [uncultured Aquimarina sp.]|uniref:hypothetical protein n=1 Tax=uncultured Aquimarina sp. TaxID=575652 RepID=UPI002626B424|nr:hypothetical protein [uncultured Aquimarina sp.]